MQRLQHFTKTLTNAVKERQSILPLNAQLRAAKRQPVSLPPWVNLLAPGTLLQRPIRRNYDTISSPLRNRVSVCLALGSETSTVGWVLCFKLCHQSYSHLVLQVLTLLGPCFLVLFPNSHLKASCHKREFGHATTRKTHKNLSFFTPVLQNGIPFLHELFD